MRFVTTVISAAILLFLLYLVIGGIADGYFGADIVPDKAAPMRGPRPIAGASGATS